MLAREELTDQERIIMARADAALQQGGSFISAFWGVECRASDNGAVSTTANGAHVANRVGHLQGGVQLGIAGLTAAAALGADDWLMTSIDASYLRPGEGAQFRGSAEVLHRGRSTAVVMTKLTDEQDRVIMTAASTHAKRE
ncbi:MAG: acyl-CoA thioesterase domain-containing protein, partial [Betaproteobacteria bacterium]